MREAATLLTAARHPDAREDLLARSGCAGPFVSLDEREIDNLGIEGLLRPRMGASRGNCRALIGTFESDRPSFREAVLRLARRLSARAPHVLWLLCVADDRSEHCALIAWSTDDSGRPLIASFSWQPDAVVDSDAETLRALSGIHDGDDSLLHARWLEVLGRDTLTRRFFRVLDAQVSGMAGAFPRMIGPQDASEIALLYATRLLFLHFLQAKGWLDGQATFLADRLDECLIGGGRFHQRVLLPLFFGTLNTPVARRAHRARQFGRVPFLNGGLFTRTPAERRAGRHRIPDERFVAIFDELFLRFRFVAREDSASWSEASVDPEMLGRAFESLMASDERKAGGVYYTPHPLVERVTGHALDATRHRSGSESFRVLDPACGSGAFLVHALETLATLRAARDTVRPIAEIRRDVLTTSIFGVDRSPTAVWLCQLRLWLAVVIESEEPDPLRVRPLPNLDRNVRVGDALTGSAFSQEQAMLAGGSKLTSLRARYARATGQRKEALARRLDREERGRVLAIIDREVESALRSRRELVSLERTRDLFGQRPPRDSEARRARRRIRDRLRALRQDRRTIADGGALPLAFGALFPDAQAHGGFDAVVGNPPWVRLHNIPAPLRLRLRESYSVFNDAAWHAGAMAANAAKGFASQVDLSALFVERSLRLLRDDGVLSLLLPSKLWRSLAGGGVRRLLMERASLLVVEDLGNLASAFDAAVYPSLVVARKTAITAGQVDVAVVGSRGRRGWRMEPRELAFDRTPGAPWLLLPQDVRLSFDCFGAQGAPLASALGIPRLGVKTGCNSAFLVTVESAARGLASIRNADGARGIVEQDLLRPALRGESVARWRRPPAHEHVIWTHDERGAALAKVPPRARAWLGRHYSDLSLRSDSRGGGRWWSLFRTDAADFSRPRVVWADFGRAPRALVLEAGDPAVPLNTCYAIHCRDGHHAFALCAILNSAPIAAWLNAIAEPARGGYRRYLGWTVGLLPLPADWERAIHVLGDASVGALDDAELTARVLDAYRLRPAQIAPLLNWQSCD